MLGKCTNEPDLRFASLSTSLILLDVDHAAELRFDTQESVQQISGRYVVAFRIRHYSRVQSRSRV